VECDAPVAEVIERGRLAGGERGRHEARPMRDQVGEAFGVRGGIARDDEALRRRGRVADQYLVEASLFVGPREVAHPGGIDLAADDVHRGAVLALRSHADHPDELDGHGSS
jgi:hypothetical protein